MTTLTLLVNSLIADLNAAAPPLSSRDDALTVDAVLLARHLLALASAKELFLHLCARLTAPRTVGVDEAFAALLLDVTAVVLAHLTRRSALYRDSLGDVVAAVAVVPGRGVSATIFGACVRLLRSVARAATAAVPFRPVDAFGLVAGRAADDDDAVSAQQWVIAVVMRVFAATVAPFDRSGALVRPPAVPKVGAPAPDDAALPADESAAAAAPAQVLELVAVLLSSETGLGVPAEFLLRHYDRVAHWHHTTHDLALARHAGDGDDDDPPAQPKSLQWSAIGYAAFLLHAQRSPLWPRGVWSSVRLLRTALASATAVVGQMGRNAQHSVDLAPGALSAAYRSDAGDGASAPLHEQERRPVLLALELVREQTARAGVGSALFVPAHVDAVEEANGAAALLVSLSEETGSFASLEAPECDADEFGVDPCSAWHAAQAFAQALEVFAVGCSDGDLRFHCLDVVERVLVHLNARESFTLLRRMLAAATSASWHEALVSVVRKLTLPLAPNAVSRARTCALLDAAVRRIEVAQLGRRDGSHTNLLEWTTSLQALFSLVGLARRRHLLVGDHVIAFHRSRCVPLRRALQQCSDEALEQRARSHDETKQLVQNARQAGVDHASHASLLEAAARTLQQTALIDCAYDFAFA
jgi:hypothetical protein